MKNILHPKRHIKAGFKVTDTHNTPCLTLLNLQIDDEHYEHLNINHNQL